MTGPGHATACLVLLAATAPPVPALPDLDAAEPQVRTAIREAHEGLVAEPGSAAAWGHYGSILDVHAFTAAAAGAYAVAAELDPDDFRWPYLLAILVSPDDPAASVDHLQRALDRNDAYAPLYLRYAAMMEAMGRPRQALVAYERAVGLEQDNPYAHAGLGRCLLATGDAGRARTHLDRAIRLDHSCRPALSALAAYARRTGDMTAARRWSHRAAAAPAPSPRDRVLAGVRRLGVSTTEIVRRANEMQQAGSPEAARRALEWLVTHNPASVRGRNRLADLYVAANDMDAAVEQYRAALAEAPDFVPARLGLAHVLSRAGRHEEAQREYDTVLAGHPSSVPAHRGLAICLAAQGRMEQAAVHFGRVIELAPDDRRARLAWGSALLGSGQYGRAAGVLESLLETPGPEAGDLVPRARYALAASLIGLAERHAHRGEADATSSALARAVELVAGTPAGGIDFGQRYTRAAGLLSQGGHWAAAIELLRGGLARFPESPRITNELAWILATCPETALRDGAEAVALAERASELAGVDGANELDTLAAAYEQAGRHDEAVAAAERGLAVAKRNGQDGLATRIFERLRRLRERRPPP